MDRIVSRRGWLLGLCGLASGLAGAQAFAQGSTQGGAPGAAAGQAGGAAGDGPGGAVALDAGQRATLGRIEQYMNGIRTLKARFLQTAADGQTASGTAWLQRPGRMRFQYDPPSPLLLVAGHGLVVFHDSQLDQTSNIPEGQTPLGLLLGPEIRFSGGTTVVGFRQDPGQVQVTVVRTGRAQEGSLTLTFAEPPLGLRSWTVVDGQGRATTVTLYDEQFGGSFDQSLFTFVDPRFYGNGPQSLGH